MSAKTPETIRIEIGAEESGRTLQALLRARCGVSHAQARGLIDAGAVRGPRAIEVGDYARRVAAGERYEVRIDPERRYRPRPALPEGPGFEAIYQDRDLLVVDKRPDLLTVPTALRENEESLVERLLEVERRRGVRRPALYALHRLDRDTSGLLLFARSRRAFEGLHEQFLARTVDRRYGTASPLIRRTALHARALAFDHPVTGRRLSLTAPVPRDLRILIKKLRRGAPEGAERRGAPGRGRGGGPGRRAGA